MVCVILFTERSGDSESPLFSPMIPYQGERLTEGYLLKLVEAGISESSACLQGGW